jgi:hypothetical protein
MPRYRVGSEGLRVITTRGIYSLPPGTVLDEIPERYEGKLEVVELDEAPNLLDRPVFRKRLRGYADKRIRPAEDKSL